MGAFFYQKRPGLGTKPFNIVKYKTMTDEKDVSGALLPDAERITPIGKIVRSTSLDELPQLWNVLKGEMSFIGPRPLLEEYLPYYTEREKTRHSVRPGISGWAQVHGRNHLPWDKRLELDAWYAEHVSFLLDLRIVWMSIVNVINRKDISTVSNEVESNFAEERRNSKKK